MGGFHLVEPAKGNSTRPHDAEPEGGNVQSTSTPSPIDGADAEKGNKAEVGESNGPNVGCFENL